MFLRRKAISEKSDEDLVALVRAGKRTALGDLWDRYAHLLYGVGMKYLKDPEHSKDAVVELFADLPAMLKKHQVERFRPWVHTVMRNRCLQLLRTRHHGHGVELHNVPDMAPEEEGAALLQEADLQRLEQAIRELNDQQRTCIELFHLQRMSYDQVAARTSLTTEQVRSHLQNGRRNLRLTLLRDAQRT
jgi:RNA polymerase sigma factor (sigma-70 family)